MATKQEPRSPQIKEEGNLEKNNRGGKGKTSTSWKEKGNDVKKTPLFSEERRGFPGGERCLQERASHKKRRGKGRRLA